MVTVAVTAIAAVVVTVAVAVIAVVVVTVAVAAIAVVVVTVVVAVQRASIRWYPKSKSSAHCWQSSPSFPGRQPNVALASGSSPASKADAGAVTCLAVCQNQI